MFHHNICFLMGVVLKPTIPSQIVRSKTIEKPNNYFQSVNYVVNLGPLNYSQPQTTYAMVTL